MSEAEKRAIEKGLRHIFQWAETRMAGTRAEKLEWELLTQTVSRDVIEALHDAGLVVRPMTGRIPVEVVSREGPSPFSKSVRCRADVRDVVLGAEQIVDDRMFSDDQFKLDHLPDILARTLLDVLRPELARDIHVALAKKEPA